MIRHTARALCAASLIIAPLALSTPAHAVTSCTVNGVPASGPTVNGTAGNDFIQCSTVDAGATVNGLGGNDAIVLTGVVDGTVTGGPGRDYLRVDPTGTVNGIVSGDADSDVLRINGLVAPGGRINGGFGNDVLLVAENQGIVDGGPGFFDVCRVNGNPPFNCEF